MSERIARTLSEQVLSRARAGGATIAVAESLTGGLIAAELTAVPGASDVMLAGVVAYSEQMKSELLAVDVAGMCEHGVVSEWTAAAMAHGIVRITGATYAVATTGVAGPGPAFAAAAGRVCLAVATPDTVMTSTHDFVGDRDDVRRQAAEAALQALLTALA